LTHSAQNLKNASIFDVAIFDCIFPNFFGPKIGIFNSREFLENASIFARQSLGTDSEPI